MKVVAFVTPWFGKELKGGAEQQVWQLAMRLAERGHAVEVLTTCCASFMQDWGTNHLPQGAQREGNVLVRRFAVDRRDGGLFNTANSQALSVPASHFHPGVTPFALGNDNAFVAENINSLSLERYLRKEKERYHCFIFIPYLYGIILNGLPLVAEKSWLQPCLHNEAYAYHPAVEEIFRRSKGLLFNSEGERQLALELFGPGIQRKAVVVGEGVEVVSKEREASLQRVQQFQIADGPFVLYLGRRDTTKNTDMLVAAYRKYRMRWPESRLRLVLAGPGDRAFGTGIPGLFDLGLVADNEKDALLLSCIALFQPSRNESFSRVIMEAWFNGKPVAAHGDCLATAMAVESCDGGLLAGSEAEWAKLFSRVEGMSEEERDRLGVNGRGYAVQFAGWDEVISRYEDILQLHSKAASQIGTEDTVQGNGIIHQLLPGFAYGDAISNQALVIRDILRKNGYRSDIITEHRDPVMECEAHIFNEDSEIGPDDGIIYHHSIGAGLTDFVVRHPGPKSLVYHNITPPDLVREHEPELASILEQGIRDLKVLAPSFPVCVGDSAYNCKDLADNGFVDPVVLPICVSPEKWNIPADPNMMARLQDGKTNILFVGRVIANKCQHDLINAFVCFQRLYGNCRLLLVGGYIEEEKYYQALKRQTQELGLEWDVFFLGKVPDTTLHACYRCSHLFWSMSEHEGFGVPLIEAMWFDLPVFAYSSSAVPETMGEGGLLFTGKDDLERLAVTARLLLDDKEVRQTVLAAQRRRVREFLPEYIGPKVSNLIQRMYANEMV